MSLKALAWAKRLTIKPASAKFVLTVFADYATERKKSYPSMQCLCEETELTPEQINTAIESLIEQKVMTDTGQRVGEQKEIRVFQLADVEQAEPPVKKKRKAYVPKTEALKEALQIYEVYPRKVGRPKALSAIVRAIQAFSFEIVMTGTKAFAAAWYASGREDLAFCPHPATFFNGERFNDDPKAWGLTASAKKTPVGPKMQEVIAYAREKEMDTAKADHWATSFYTFWNKKGWLLKGKQFDWQARFSAQLTIWRAQQQ